MEHRTVLIVPSQSRSNISTPNRIQADAFAKFTSAIKIQGNIIVECNSNRSRVCIFCILETLQIRLLFYYRKTMLKTGDKNFLFCAVLQQRRTYIKFLVFSCAIHSHYDGLMVPILLCESQQRARYSQIFY